eukprot:CAMPEP_0184307508 /NCGR_PEP_ID=MMETSP1049-20130417/16243_1 /TAXON_ID=77928 /ORGANISM="Proteomonas sulcata, Strain CCMP704" /LENGTH=275 /DNA_ID=CAMNT_0026620023 /DNA_START=86 /DNA_END=913 /DNA_ORIENTATION=+
MTIGKGVSFEDKRVKAIDQIYISNSHPDAVTSWNTFTCSVDKGTPKLEIERKVSLQQGIWKGYMSFDSTAKDLFLRGEIMKEMPLLDDPTPPPTINRSRMTISSQNKASSAMTSRWVVDTLGFSSKFNIHEVDRAAVNRCNVMAFTHDLQSLLNDPEMSDLCFIVEGRKIFVHKAILYARCPYFKSMLTSGMKESEGREVPLPDIQYEPFFVLCEYLYMGEVHMEPARALDVLQLADRYLISGLKRICEVCCEWWNLLACNPSPNIAAITVKKCE